MDKSEQSPQTSNEGNFSLLHVARFFLGGMAIIYMFGQLFFSSFSLVSTGVAISAFVVALTSKRKMMKGRFYQVVLACCIIGTAGVSFSIYDYYSQYQVPGNNYPLATSIAVIAAFTVAGIYSVISKNA